MKCAGHWWMEVLNVKRSHFQPRVPCLCSQIPTQEESKSISRHAAFQKTQSPRSLLKAEGVGEDQGGSQEHRAMCWEALGGGHAWM